MYLYYLYSFQSLQDFFLFSSNLFDDSAQTKESAIPLLLRFYRIPNEDFRYIYKELLSKYFFSFHFFFIIIKKECQQWKTSANKMSLKTGEKLKQLKVKLPFELNVCVYHINHCWHGACNTFFFFFLKF